MDPSPTKPRGTIPQDDYDAIVASARDYAEGWYGGDADRMARCLHGELAKRSVEPDAAPGTWRLRPNLSRDRLVTLTREGGGSEVPEGERRYQVDVLDVYEHVAVVRCVSPHYVDFLQLAKFGDRRWLIVNVLWEARPSA